jgi:hypothetical protein
MEASGLLQARTKAARTTLEDSMERERVGEHSGEDGCADMVRRPGSPPRKKAILVAGQVATTLACLVGLGFAGAQGCGDTIDSKGQSEVEPQEAVGAAQQAAVVTPTICVQVKTATGAHNHDTMISLEKPNDNYGSNAFAFVSGGTTFSPALPQQALFTFDLSSIPAGATIISSGMTLSQTTTGALTANVHKILAAWNENTVTWNSFGGAYDAAVYKTFNTGLATVTIDIKTVTQDWINGVLPNNGLLIEAAGAPVDKIKTREFGTVAQQPFLNICYKVLCAAGTADCDGNAANGCETNTNSPANCGGCGVVCAVPANAAPACPAGVCGLGACNLGFDNCDGNAANGCETNLATNANCGSCGTACNLPNSNSDCGSGTCKVVTCNAGSFDCNGNNLDGCEATPCVDGSHCGQNSDCGSNVCQAGFCLSPVCNDHTKNGTETDVDCGGSCPDCADGQGCGVNGDCQSNVCAGGVCQAPTCSDATKNGDETDVDCGGSCGPCANGNQCSVGGDCTSGVCMGGVCQAPTCTDGLKNGTETGVDCGSLCPPCGNGVGCVNAGDCVSGVCTGGVCQLPNCTDGVKNGTETDTDCGGTCAPCNPNQGCASASDCATGVCAGGHCQPATCSDGVKNGNETGVDCGGACTIPEVCNGVDDDCNGSTDEGLGSTTCGIGACQVTVQNCVGGQVQSCTPGSPVAEVCDGLLDDDCDGVVDNGCDCVNGSTQGCYTGSGATQNVGVCHGGTQTCQLGHWGACNNQVTPSAETCDGLDNDCNGQTDEGLGTTICGVGGCQVLVQNCVNGVVQACVPSAPQPEICDGVDNNCDGQVDNGLGTITCGVGACANTVPSCVNGAANVCNPHATDGVACNDNQSCTQNDACSNGVCVGANIPAGTICRASTGACDPAETCTGNGGNCPADALSAAGTICRAAGGVCDVAESCTGASAACPADSKVASGTVCRAAAGVCDVAESCDGANNACPVDSFVSAATVCRAAAGGGLCDVAENCTGNSGACPGDSFVSSATVCRAAAGVCDVAERCTGGSAACPGDTLASAGTTCRNSTGVCDPAETCTGASVSCPGDSFTTPDTLQHSCGGAGTAGNLNVGSTVDVSGQVNESGDDYFVFNFTNTGLGNGYSPQVNLINDGGGIYRIQVMTSGCGGNANGCGGSLQTWGETYNQDSDPGNCKAVGNCSDGTGRVTTTVVRVFRASGVGASCNTYTVRATQ